MALAHVLIITADINYARLLKIKFEQQIGYEVVVASVLDEAYGAVKEKLRIDGHPFDCILVDITGGQMEAIKHMKLETKSPLIVLTSDPIKEVEEEAKRLGAVDVLAKDEAFDKMLDKVADAMARTKTYQLMNSQLRLASQIHHLSLRNTAFLIGCMAAVVVITMAACAFFADLFVQLYYKHDYIVPGWIGIGIIPAVVAIVGWMYSQKQQIILKDAESNEPAKPK